MKLRILGNSIRLRLTQTEVVNLYKLGFVRASTQFGPNNFLEYELSLSDNSEFIVTFRNGIISVALPESIGKPWCKGAEISIRHQIRMDRNTNLSILIEKDFKCKTERVGENEDDMFPNPNC